jgi:isopenicillin N synthase-like dioxygenase
MNYYTRAMQVAMDVLCAIAGALDLDRDYFADKFSNPMALLRAIFILRVQIGRGIRILGSQHIPIMDV